MLHLSNGFGLYSSPFCTMSVSPFKPPLRCLAHIDCGQTLRQAWVSRFADWYRQRRRRLSRILFWSQMVFFTVGPGSETAADDNAGNTRYRSASEKAAQLHTKGTEWHWSRSDSRVECWGLKWMQSCNCSNQSMFMAAYLSQCIPIHASGPEQHLLEQMRTWCKRSGLPDWS